MALMNIMDEIYHHIDNRDTDLGMYLDLEKGFDTDVLDILLFKLGEFWSGDMFINYNWLKDSNYSQFVAMNNILNVLFIYYLRCTTTFYSWSIVMPRRRGH